MAGCFNRERIDSSKSSLLGKVTIERSGKNTEVNYTFLNEGSNKVGIIGGASYKLYKNDRLLEEGAVPIKDYIDLKPEETYADKKVFINLLPGTYRVEVRWDNTMAVGNFTF
ncbi:hypothetical protein J2Z69_003327 [Paenibacillus shirakamiensis]|uniref:Intracellular proteinase inhibitor BsuPI domain-containing protein n=2 Tax=Paenibacillus shirakamiensis TaxID=1265935 RepID=A0ABS4JMB5_9BACL|nr:hypothetical protein [Paenibacillus shirakamiensis]